MAKSAGMMSLYAERVAHGRCRGDRRNCGGPAHAPPVKAHLCPACYERHGLHDKRRRRERKIDRLRDLRRKASDPLYRARLRAQIEQLKSELAAIRARLDELDPELPEAPEQQAGAA